MSKPNVKELRRRWRQMAVDMQHPAFELTPEEVAPLLDTFWKLQRAGRRFDAAIVALFSILERQIHGGEDDSDSDIDVVDWEADDPDADLDPAAEHITDPPETRLAALAAEREADEAARSAPARAKRAVDGAIKTVRQAELWIRVQRWNKARPRDTDITPPWAR